MSLTLLLPGIQGRWEWLRPAVRALEAYGPTISFSLREPRPAPGDQDTLDVYVPEIDRALDAAGAATAAIVGVSFGGVIALHYAAARPERVSALVLDVTPGPSWRPERRVVGYLARPRWSAAAFVYRASKRMWEEFGAAIPSRPARFAFFVRYALRCASHPPSPTQMAARVARWQRTDVRADCARITAPTLVLTGEAGIDRVVPIESSLEYLTLIPHAEHATLAGTGHVGLVTRAEGFAETVSRFLSKVKKEK